MVKTKMRKEESYIDKEILKMAKKKNRLKTITAYVIEECPDLDEIVCLARVIGVMKENNFELKQYTIKSVFNEHYNEEFHGDARSYLKWLYKISLPVDKSGVLQGTQPENTQYKKIKIEKEESTKVKNKSCLESKSGKKWKCPDCKRERKYDGKLIMKVCSCCVVEMEVVSA